MKNYKVHIDMMLIIARLKAFRLKEYNHNQTIIFIEANDPDDACYKTFLRLSEIVLLQDQSVSTAIMLKELKNDFKIVKVECP
jgi:hypothetical protein